ncbi:hypothetical protein J6590_011597 [Homalodisca vitripennis]|nr:hypothetical protein J6590_011597 [Homalodisca vitripennis]
MSGKYTLHQLQTAQPRASLYNGIESFLGHQQMFFDRDRRALLRDNLPSKCLYVMFGTMYCI